MPYGQGSGFVWGEKGHVVTCYHLVKGAAEVKVRRERGRRRRAG
jgi:S1-C subfamily serine protease